MASFLAVAVALAEAVVDWTTWVELDVSTVHGVPLVLAAVARNRRLLWCIAISAAMTAGRQMETLRIPPGNL